MGRAGPEPATLGLKARASEKQLAATSGKCLHMRRSYLATKCYEMHFGEASPYARGTRSMSEETIEAT
jgi:hypothetical protein